MTKTKDTSSEISAAVVAMDIKFIKDDIAEIKNKLDNQYVTQTEFRPVRQVVYGMVSIILITVAGALIALVVMD